MEKSLPWIARIGHDQQRCSAGGVA